MWIDSFFQWLLISSLMGCILTLVILLVKLIFRRHLSTEWHYGLWLFLIIKLLIPFGPASSWSVFTVLNYLSEKIPAVAFVTADTAEKVHHYFNPFAHRGMADPAMDYSISISKNPHLILLFLIWLAGAALFSVYLISQNRNTVKLLKNIERVHDGPVLQLFESCKRMVGIRGKIKLLYTDQIQIPVLYGVVAPSLLLPRGISEQISLEQLKYIFLHELAHYKRKDPYVNLGMCFLQIMHWFNPVIALAFYQMRREREAATDSLALSYLKDTEYRNYGDTIILFLSNMSSSKTIALGFLDNKISIKGRIFNIAFYHRNSPHQRLLGAILAIGVGFFVLTNSSGLPQTDYYAKDLSNIEKADLGEYFQGFQGSFVLLSQDRNKITIYNETKSRERVSPDSTYKIYSALMGLENKVLRDADTELKWDRTIYPFDIWNRNHSLRSAIAYSVNWYFNQVDQGIGKNKLQLGLRQLDYGNVDISGGIKNFWVESSLKISPIEQVIELKKLDTYELSFSHRSIDIVKDIIHIPQPNNGVLSGKTGTGTVNHHNIRGWFIGYVGRPEHRYYFATYIQGSEHADGKKAKEITLKILKNKNLY
ncbi:MAG TPA: BlaR1 family beta-lactam sensor/signal transducer [Firmicutes bacterium]|jgi:bla regulator protein blaR1|nr:BlaR1 family beta-lactam sensor/signal transducer [Bacillota bacterium]